MDLIYLDARAGEHAHRWQLSGCLLPAGRSGTNLPDIPPSLEALAWAAWAACSLKLLRIFKTLLPRPSCLILPGLGHQHAPSVRACKQSAAAGSKNLGTMPLQRRLGRAGLKEAPHLEPGGEGGSNGAQAGVGLKDLQLARLTECSGRHSGIVLKRCRRRSVHLPLTQQMPVGRPHTPGLVALAV